MDNQPLTPTPVSFASISPSGGGIGGGGSGSGPLMFILIAVLGLGALIFAVLTLTFYDKATTATTTLQTQEKASALAAATIQKKSDDAAYELAGESPFRSYTAPDADGSFVINFPKDWSGFVDSEQDGTQLSLVLNPDFIQESVGTDLPTAARVMLINTPSAEYLQDFSENVTAGTMTQKSITISGQPGYDFGGTFSDGITHREIVIPVRDKVLVFTNENTNYSSEFNEILAQAKINP